MMRRCVKGLLVMLLLVIRNQARIRNIVPPSGNNDEIRMSNDEGIQKREVVSGQRRSPDRRGGLETAAPCLVCAKRL